MYFYYAPGGNFPDPSRPSQFVTAREAFMLDFAKSCFYWYKACLALLHTTNGGLGSTEVAMKFMMEPILSYSPTTFWVHYLAYPCL